MSEIVGRLVAEKQWSPDSYVGGGKSGLTVARLSYERDLLRGQQPEVRPPLVLVPWPLAFPRPPHYSRQRTFRMSG